MTISAQPRKAGPYAGNGVAASFAFAFKVFAATDVRVLCTDSQGQETELVLGSGYSVTLNPDQNAAPGGQVVLPAALAAGLKLTVIGGLPISQTLNLSNSGGFYPKTINEALDRQAMYAQQNAEKLARALKFQASDDAASVGELPQQAQRAGRVLAFESGTGKPVAGPTIAAVGSVSSASAAIEAVAASLDDIEEVLPYLGDIAGAAGNATAAQLAQAGAESARDLAQGYATAAEAAAAAAGPVQSVAGRTGNVTLAAGDIADLGSAATMSASSFATTTQGGKADTALQPNAGLAAIDSAANILLNTIAKQYFVEVFRQPGDTDSQVIKKALAAIEADNKPAVLRFESGRTYTYDSSHSLGYINDLDIDLNGAKFVRANSGVVSTTLTADLPTSGGSSTTLYVASTPTNWSIGDIICARVGDGDNGISNVRRITGISGNTVTIHAALDGYTGLNPIPSGTTIVKSWSLFVGRPSANDSSTLLTEGANKRIRIHGGLIDGNRANQINRSWRYSTEIMLHSEGGAVYDCKFKDTSNECLVGHGFTVQGCTFVDLGGSALHTSVNDQTAAVVTPCMVYGNTFRRTNLFGQAKSGHAEGAITFSWGAGNLIIQGNFFDGGNEAILGGFGPSSGANADIFFTFSGNICKGYQKIFNALLSPIGVTITGNTFHDCGDNTSIGGAFTGNANKFTGNAASGNTVLPNIPSAPITSATQFTVLSGGASEPATPLASTALRAVYVSPADIGGTSLGSHQFVVESSVVARIALASGTNSDGTIAFFNKDQSTFGSAFISYAPGSATFYFSTNIATGNHNFRTAIGQSHLQLHADGSTVHVRRAGLVYFGDKNTDGSWAIDASGNDLVFKRRESGSWVTKSTIAA